MRNFLHRGRTCTFAAPYAVASGAGFLAGALFAVANTDAAQGADVEGDVQGVFTLPKSTAAGSAIAANSLVYWDDTNKLVTGTKGTNKLIGGTLKLAAADGDATVVVRLNGTTVS